MNDRLEKSFHNIKTPGLNNPETHVLTHNGFSTRLVLIFTDLNETHIYKLLYRNSPNQEIEKVMSFDYLNVFKRNEHTEDYHIRKTDYENFLFEIGDKNHIYVEEKVISFKTNDIIVKFSSEYGFNDVTYPYAYGDENICFMLHQKQIPIQEYEKSTEKTEYEYLYKLNENIKR